MSLAMAARSRTKLFASLGIAGVSASAAYRWMCTSAAAGSAGSSAPGIQEILTQHQVTVFSTTYCPYCAAAKNQLQELGIKPFVIELNTHEQGADLKNALISATNQRTVPNIFIGTHHVGGYDSLRDLISNRPDEFQSLLQSANNTTKE